jgi:hypothetical protein
MSYAGSDYYDCNQNDELMIEPRLTEYIKKKKFYKENRIDSEFLDKQFSITKGDIVKINEYLKGNKSALNSNKNSYDDFIDPSKASFPSSEFKKDPRFDRIKAKQQKESDANEQRHDYNVISKSYDMYRNDRPFASAIGDDFRKSEFNPNDWLKNSNDEMIDEYNRNQKPPKESFSKNNTYTNPKSSYNSYLSKNSTINSDTHTIDAIIGSLNSYSNRDNQYENYSRRRENRGENENGYRPVPFIQGGQNEMTNSLNKDIEVDTYMRFGTTPLRAGKSLGYKSTAEHSFSFIDSDIQNPDHVVMDRGIPSRSFNKETARPYNRYTIR